MKKVSTSNSYTVVHDSLSYNISNSLDAARALAKARYDAITAGSSELLITGSDDHTLFLWSLFSSAQSEGGDAKAGKIKPLTRLVGHQRQVSHVSFSPDGRWAASAGFDNCLRVWEGRTGK